MFSRRSGRKGDADMSCVFVHAGAGYHSKENERNHLQACSDACKSAMLILKNGGSAVDAAEMAIKVLEDREITNAGYGSNPNIDGVVECDAIVVDHLGRSGAVGAVAQIKNPVSLARVLLDCTSQPLSLRRVPPNLLVGEGATNFAHDHGIPILPYSYLVSPSAKQRWQKWRAELMRAERIDGDSWIFRPSASLAEVERELDMEPLEQSRRAGDTRQAFTRSSIDVTETSSFSRDEEHTIPDREDHITDTIGAIAVDRHGNIACAASSGGISMKHRGRVGPAALIGVGAFVIPVNTNDPDRTSVAAVTSGTGEHMATTFAAHAAAQRIYHPRRPRNVQPCDEPEALQAFITSDFLGHPSVRHSHSAGAIGALVVKKTLDGIWLYFAHNTDSFALASMHGEEPRPVCTMSRKSNDRAASGNAGLAHGGRGMRFGRSSGGRTR
ncbi:N-terminal nucleophile aminohydrolase [Dissoconium aciculare CBS 342.82]|uniref:N-terminal nucleophile aminohydrolase n=1 Tax=Dissoconium aciculare CBS 342.82 TaxID=1314786 RepID=A0A6J3M0W6_9PEZI|nr:N-terminal nucleophile aminohydrolase [Dissoconium aciculare CBS 342.82]KAF1821523.1 N-terminal nucleophile aminohydrolase [Dissoconium aciculare CBS 342.82]